MPIRQLFFGRLGPASGFLVVTAPAIAYPATPMATGSNETAVKSAGESLSAKAAKESAPPALSLAQLLATVFVTGAAVITIEILGTRIIGPVFGVSPRGRAAA